MITTMKKTASKRSALKRAIGAAALAMLAASAMTAHAAQGAAAPALELGKHGLKLLDAKGQALDEFGVRAKRWDRRRLADGTTVALLQDADSGALRLIEVAGGRLRERARWAGPAFDVEAVCLYLEPRQQMLQAFLLGSDGLAEQWLLADPPAGSKDKPPAASATPRQGQVLRQLATVPDAKGCIVRDDEATLYVAEAGVGLWSFEADPERAGRKLAAPGLAPQDAALWLEARAATPRPVIPVAVPSAQTDPVRGGGDAADDPAIWVHPSQPS